MKKPLNLSDKLPDAKIYIEVHNSGRFLQFEKEAEDIEGERFSEQDPEICRDSIVELLDFLTNYAEEPLAQMLVKLTKAIEEVEL
jgi:hypothetical protein